VDAGERAFDIQEEPCHDFAFEPGVLDELVNS
jgi:hypothetical protein